MLVQQVLSQLSGFLGQLYLKLTRTDKVSFIFIDIYVCAPRTLVCEMRLYH